MKNKKNLILKQCIAEKKKITCNLLSGEDENDGYYKLLSRLNIIGNYKTPFTICTQE